jgi:3-isopropylmalate/(R)-2-methylmalate dehydratase small subunit
MARLRPPDGSGAPVTPDLLLEQEIDASILLYRELFDTATPETVIARLTSLGIQVIIALGFEARLYDKCISAGLLPVILDEETIEELEGCVTSRPGLAATVDLERQVIERPDMEPVPFGVDPRARNKLLLGLTDLEEALRYRRDGATLRDEDRKRRPWLYDGA